MIKYRCNHCQSLLRKVPTTDDNKSYCPICGTIDQFTEELIKLKIGVDPIPMNLLDILSKKK